MKNQYLEKRHEVATYPSPTATPWRIKLHENGALKGHYMMG